MHASYPMAALVTTSSGDRIASSDIKTPNSIQLPETVSSLHSLLNLRDLRTTATYVGCQCAMKSQILEEEIHTVAGAHSPVTYRMAPVRRLMTDLQGVPIMASRRS